MRQGGITNILILKKTFWSQHPHISTLGTLKKIGKQSLVHDTACSLTWLHHSWIYSTERKEPGALGDFGKAKSYELRVWGKTLVRDTRKFFSGWRDCWPLLGAPPLSATDKVWRCPADGKLQQQLYFPLTWIMLPRGSQTSSHSRAHVRLYSIKYPTPHGRLFPNEKRSFGQRWAFHAVRGSGNVSDGYGGRERQSFRAIFSERHVSLNLRCHPPNSKVPTCPWECANAAMVNGRIVRVRNGYVSPCFR